MLRKWRFLVLKMEDFAFTQEFQPIVNFTIISTTKSPIFSIFHQKLYEFICDISYADIEKKRKKRESMKMMKMKKQLVERVAE